MKAYNVTVVVRLQADDEDHALIQALEIIADGQFTPDVTEVVLTT